MILLGLSRGTHYFQPELCDFCRNDLSQRSLREDGVDGNRSNQVQYTVHEGAGTL